MSLSPSTGITRRSWVAPAILSGFSLFACVNSTSAETTISVSNLIMDYKDKDYRTYGYLAQEIVSSGNSLAAWLGRKGYEGLNLKERSSGARWVYLATALQLQVRVQWANALYFGHEFSHFATAHQFGRDEHFFRDTKNGEEIKYGKAYLAIVKGGQVGGAAVSRGVLDPVQQERHSHEGIMSTTAGLNWQMNYSEKWVRQHYAFGKKDFFDAPDYFLNRSYLSAYAFGDKKRSKNGRVKGDVLKWAEHVEANNPDEAGALGKAATYSLVANLLSPSYWTAANSFNNFIASGETKLNNPVLDRGSSLTWDLPQYLNRNSMTIAPTVYWRPAGNAVSKLGADNILLGTSIEVPVIGEDENEIQVSVTGKWQDFDADFSVTKSGDGHFAEIGLAYNVNNNLAVTAGAASANGKTLRGSRNFPHGKAAGWFGLRISF